MAFSNRRDASRIGSISHGEVDPYIIRERNKLMILYFAILAKTKPGQEMVLIASDSDDNSSHQHRMAKRKTKQRLGSWLRGDEHSYSVFLFHDDDVDYVEQCSSVFRFRPIPTRE